MTDKVDITKEDVTEIILNGSGVFDHLMKANKTHLLEEFSNNRINETNYSTVYLGTTQAAMAQAIQFALQAPINERQAGLIEAQCKMVDQQTLTEVANTALTEKQLEKVDAEVALLVKELDIKDQQIINATKQNELTDQQIVKMQKDIEYTDAQILIAGEQLNNLKADTQVKEKQIDKMVQDIQFSEQQVLKAKQEVLLMQEQVLTAPVQREKIEKDILLTSTQINTQTEQAILIRENQKRTISETSLVDQKLHTEEAQIKDFVDGDDVKGVVGAKNALYEAQRQGFFRDAEQKAAKIYGDFWNVARSTATDEAPFGEILGFATEGYPTLNKVLGTLRSGVNAQ